MKPVCECCGERGANDNVAGYAVSKYRGVGLTGAAFSTLCCRGGDEAVAAMMDRIRARRQAPNVLPPTLPEGTVALFGRKRYVLEGTATLGPPCASAAGPKETYHGTWRLADGGVGNGYHASWIQWATVPIQEASPAHEATPVPEVAAAPGCENCRAPKHDVKSRFCAYCVNGDADKKATNDAELQLRNDAARARMAAADRRATPRQRQRPTSPARQSVAEGHPSTWPSQEGEP